ncbi:MAG TPA: alpha/beta fold hydrolase, partial [Bryobacteraceae bacterium]
MRVCLIHGSTQGPHGWDLLARELMAWGAKVVAVDMPVDRPSEGAEFYANEVVKQMPAGEAPVVVAHSSAGLILPVVASRIKVSRLIYLAAVIPEPGKVFLDRVKRTPKMFQPDWPGKDPTKSEELARHFLFHDCDERTARWAMTTLRLWMATGVAKEACPLRQMPAIPTDYISGTLDRALNPVWWEEAAQSL